MDKWKSKVVWSGNNGYHVSQEDVIKLRVALYPTFPDSYSKIRLSEQGLNMHLVGFLLRATKPESNSAPKRPSVTYLSL